MAISLSDFQSIVVELLRNTTEFITATQEAILINDPVSISLFTVAFGFVVLELIIYTLNRLRGTDMSGFSDTSGMKNDAFLKDYVRRRKNVVHDRQTGYRK